MGYINKSVSVNSDEKTFIKTFVEQLTSSDSRITCDTNIDEQFADTTNTPVITFNIANSGGCKIQFIRKTALSTTEYIYFCDFYINSIKYSTVDGIRFSEILFVGSDITRRTLKFTVVSNEKVLYIAFGNYDASMPNSAKASFMCIADGNLTAATVNSDANAVSGNFTVTSQINNGLLYSFATRIGYSIANDKLEIIKNKSLLDGNGSKILTFDGLYDCSTMPQFVNFNIDTSNYFSIGTHTIMPI